jgi:hypothetical protein
MLRFVRAPIAWTAAALPLTLGCVALGFTYIGMIRPARFDAVATLRPGPAGEGRTRHTVVMILDGARRDAFEQLAALRPALVSLRAQAAVFDGHTGHPSMSRPMYATLASGATPRLHGVTSNGQLGPLRVDTVIAGARSSGFDVLLRDDRSSFWWDLFDATPKERVESLGDTLSRLGAATRAFAYVHVLDPDEAAHAHGTEGPEYRAALSRALLAVERVAGALDLRRDALIVTADHGHIARGGHGGPEREVVEVPLWMVGRGIRAAQFGRANAIDIAPTAAVLAGLPLPAHGEGRPLFEALDLNPSAMDTLVQRWLSQRWRLANAILGALAAPLLPPPQIPEGALAVPSATALVRKLAEPVDAAYARLELRDVGWRALSALPILLVVAWWIRRVRPGALAWTLGGTSAAIFFGAWAAMFPFSLSAIRDQVEFCVVVAIVASVAVDVAILLTWLFVRIRGTRALWREVGVATMSICAMELAVWLAVWGIGWSSGLPPAAGFFVPALSLAKTAVCALAWGVIVPWVAFERARRSRAVNGRPARAAGV